MQCMQFDKSIYDPHDSLQKGLFLEPKRRKGEKTPSSVPFMDVQGNKLQTIAVVDTVHMRQSIPDQFT